MMRLAQLIRSIHDAGPDPIRTGAEPYPSIEQRILREVVGAYPQGGNSLEAAVRLALRLGWRARHDLQRYQEERAVPADRLDDEDLARLAKLPPISRDPISVQARQLASNLERYAASVAGLGSDPKGSWRDEADAYVLAAQLYAPTLVAYLARRLMEKRP